MTTPMPATTPHFLVITEGSYDASTVHGVFGSLEEARNFVESHNDDKPNYFSMADIEQWDGATCVSRLARWQPKQRPLDWTEQ